MHPLETFQNYGHTATQLSLSCQSICLDQKSVLGPLDCRPKQRNKVVPPQITGRGQRHKPAEKYFTRDHVSHNVSYGKLNPKFCIGPILSAKDVSRISLQMSSISSILQSVPLA